MCLFLYSNSGKEAFRVPANRNFIGTIGDTSKMIFAGDVCNIILQNLPPLQRFVYVLSTSFHYNTTQLAKINNIQGGEYLFKSHDYRHTIATQFYDTGVPLQSIRDYLGHDYEEMTEQYIDYMPKKIARASDEFFSTNSLLATMRGGENENG